MRDFDLLEPGTIEEAKQLLDEEKDALLIGGGTALLILIKQGLVRPRTLINLKKIAGADAITFTRESGLRIEALATIHDVETSTLVREHFPVLAHACHEVANIRIRHLATIGGNLAHGDYQSDPPGVLVALDASVELQGAGGRRMVRVADFLVAPYETAAAPGEIVTAVSVPPVRGRLFGHYIKFTTGSSEERPTAGITALLRAENGKPVEARLAVGAVGATPLLIRAADPSEESLPEIAVRAAKTVDAVEDLRASAGYKKHLVGVLGRRALAEVWRQAQSA